MIVHLLSMITSYKDLIVWQKSIELCILIYTITNYFPKSELFGLVMQMRRAAVSIASNIAEGNGRSKKTKEYIQYLYIALGSAQELETQLIISEKLNFIKNENVKEIFALAVEIQKMLNKMINLQK